METIIKVNPSELNKTLLDKIKKYIGNGGNTEITISIHENVANDALRNETRDDYFDRLDKSINNLEKGNVINFTAAEFKAFSAELLNAK